MFENDNNQNQEKIVETRDTFTFEGGQITLAPPASGEFANGKAWKHGYKMEIVFGKTVVPIKSRAMYDSLLQNLSRRKVKEFADKLPQMPSASDLD